MKAVFKTTGGKDPIKDSSEIYAAGDVIFRQGDLGTEMYIIQEVQVEIVKHIGSESHGLSHLDNGDFFAEVAILANVARSADAIAASEVRVFTSNDSPFHH